MAGYTVIADVSRYLLELTRSAVCPLLLPSREQVALCAPSAKDRDSYLCLYMYSVDPAEGFVPQVATGILDRRPRRPPTAVTLRYILFQNHHVQAALDATAEHRLLGRLIQFLADDPQIDLVEIHAAATRQDEPAAISFSHLSNQEKQLLWNGFSEPLRPALYLEVGPVLIGSETKEAVPRVREMEGAVARV